MITSYKLSKMICIGHEFKPEEYCPDQLMQYEVNT